MTLRERLRESASTNSEDRLYRDFGVLANPFPASNQTSGNPHLPTDADRKVEDQIVTFWRDSKSQVIVVEGTQGVGKTNFLNHFEEEIRGAAGEDEGYYMVRYLADPESSFEGTTRRLFEELGTEHMERLRNCLQQNPSAIEEARSHDMRAALRRLAKPNGDSSSDGGNVLGLMMQWLLGLRVLKAHRLALGVQFRLDTVESKTAALRDLVQVSAAAGALKGIFLLLDELEKQDGVLGPTAVVRYLSALRSIVDALPERLFLMIGITPDAQMRYSIALPALRSRLQNQIALHPLRDVDDAKALADFYVQYARRQAAYRRGDAGGDRRILPEDVIERRFHELLTKAERKGDSGVRQREFLHDLHVLAERQLQSTL